jgi:CheY-like chemotaxis protein
MLAVSDTGTGMTPEVIANAFEPFFTTKPVGKGSGLGLSMVYGLMKQSGGHVAIYSELGQGTTIRLYLPQAQVGSTFWREEKRVEPIQQAKAELILVVEDDTYVRQLAVNMLNSLGYRTVETGDAWTALKLLEEQPEIVLLFTDVVLPGSMSGVDLAREARRQRPGLKVLFTSGYTEPVPIYNGHAQEGTELLIKPYRKSSLANKMHAMLAAASLTDATESVATQEVSHDG